MRGYSGKEGRKEGRKEERMYMQPNPITKMFF